MKIKGFEKLTLKQQEHVLSVNRQQVECSGTERKPGMKIVEAWVDENNTTCVKLVNGEWYHYYLDSILNKYFVNGTITVPCIRDTEF